MTLLDRHTSISHVGSYIQACTQETWESGDRKTDLIVCGNPPAKLRTHSVTVLHVQSHAWYVECTRYGHAYHHPQLHNRSGSSVLRNWHTVGVCIMQMMRGRATLRHAMHRTLHWWPHQTVCTEGILYSSQSIC